MIKKLITIGLLLASLSGAAWADGNSPKEPAKKTVKTMLDYKDELGMTDDQVKEVSDALKSFQVTITEQRTALQTEEKEFKELLAANAPLSDIKAKLRQISDTRFNLRYADVLTSRRVSDALKPEQMKKWREIQAKVRAQAKAQAQGAKK